MVTASIQAQTMLASDIILQNRYRIIRQLGQGGMGTVYLAADQRLGSQVALKETSFDHVHLRGLQPRDQARIRKAFRQEARLLSRLRHRALPHVIDYFAEGKDHYLVMQFIDGQDLEQLLAERKKLCLGPFPTDQALEWADQLLDALEYLHSRKLPIIHHDIKPQNLKVDPASGEVILLDFGLAKGGATEASQASLSLRGYTRQYAPLEQIEGRGTDPRSDLYALAATLHRLLTGELPPPATTRAASLLSRQPDPLLPINQLNPQTPAAVAAAISRALALNPSERPATARELRRELRQAGRLDAQPDAQFDTQFDDASLAVRDSQSRIETLAPITEEPATATTRPENLTEFNSTYVGQTTPTSDLQLRSTPGSKETGKLPAARRLRKIWTGFIVASILLLATAAVALRPGDQRRIPSPPLRDEALSYGLAVEAPGGEAATLSADQPLAPGRQFKLRFTPKESDYLYIIAPNARETPATFLTAQPNPGWGVKMNQVAANASYDFPPRPDKWLRITGEAETESYLIVFAAAPLSAPSFLTEAAGRALTEAEQREMAAFRQRYQAEVSTEQRRDQSVVTVPQERPANAPLIFEINVKRQIKQQ